MTDRHERYYCRACDQDDAALQGAFRLASEYAALLKPEQCVPEETYRHRLRQCGLCPRLQGHTCGICGCFVIVRARRIAMDCPDPAGSRWLPGAGYADTV